MSDKVKKKSIFSNVFFLIYLAGFIILTLFDPLASFRRVHHSARDKACYSNIRVLQGAVEIYNMDNSMNKGTTMSSLDQNILLEKGYIRGSDILKCPETTKNATYSGEHLTEDGEIICSYHGGLIAEGPYNKDKEYKNQIVYKVQVYLEDCLKRTPGALLWPVGLVFLVFQIIR